MISDDVERLYQMLPLLPHTLDLPTRSNSRSVNIHHHAAMQFGGKHKVIVAVDRNQLTVAVFSDMAEQALLVRGGRATFRCVATDAQNNPVADDLTLIHPGGNADLSEACFYNPALLDRPVFQEGPDTRAVLEAFGPCPVCRQPSLCGLEARCHACGAGGVIFAFACRQQAPEALAIADRLRVAACHVCRKPYAHHGTDLVCRSCTVIVSDSVYRIGDTADPVTAGPPSVTPGQVLPVQDAHGRRVGRGRVLNTSDEPHVPRIVKCGPGTAHVLLLRQPGVRTCSVVIESFEFEFIRSGHPRVVHAIPGVATSGELVLTTYRHRPEDPCLLNGQTIQHADLLASRPSVPEDERLAFQRVAADLAPAAFVTYRETVAALLSAANRYKAGVQRSGHRTEKFLVRGEVALRSITDALRATP